MMDEALLVFYAGPSTPDQHKITLLARRAAIIRLGQHNVIAWPKWVKPPAGPPWSVTDADRRRRQTPEGKTILAPLHYLLVGQ